MGNRTPVSRDASMVVPMRPTLVRPQQSKAASLLLGALPATAFAQPAASAGPSWLVVITEIFLLTIFCGALWVVYKIWMRAMDHSEQRPEGDEKRTSSLFGKTEAGFQSKSFRFKAAGAGLGGTIVILALAVVAMYILNNQVVTPP